jgi:hypothetical protein
MDNFDPELDFGLAGEAQASAAEVFDEDVGPDATRAQPAQH